MAEIAYGGKNIYGFPIGILMLSSRLPRIPGDMGNATTWNFPVLYKVVKEASPHKVVREGDPALLTPFINAAELEKRAVRHYPTVAFTMLKGNGCRCKCVFYFRLINGAIGGPHAKA